MSTRMLLLSSLNAMRKATTWKILTMNQTISLISYKVSSIDNSLL